MLSPVMMLLGEMTCFTNKNDGRHAHSLQLVVQIMEENVPGDRRQKNML